MSFSNMVTELCKKSSLRAQEVNERQATIRFTTDNGVHEVSVKPFGDVWEFCCPTSETADSPAEFPPGLMSAVLLMNSTLKRGMWAIEADPTAGCAIAFLHNVNASDLTPGAFGRFAREAVRHVESMEASINVLRRLSAVLADC